MRFIAIGDIHGCLDEFQELIRLVAPGPGDRVFCLGDFMDRGPDPVGCVQFARESGFGSVLGNHEEKHLRWRRHEERRAKDPGYRNPMRPMRPERAAQNAALTADDIAWLQALPRVVEPHPGWVLVHAGLFPGKTIEEQVKDRELRDKIIRIRWVDKEGEFIPLEDDTALEGPDGAIPWTQAYDGPRHVVYGHAVQVFPKVSVGRTGCGNTYGIDTGCVFGGALTAMVVDGDKSEFVQVKAKKAYAPMRQRGVVE